MATVTGDQNFFATPTSAQDAPRFMRGDRVLEKQAARSNLNAARQLETGFEGRALDKIATGKRGSKRTAAYRAAQALRDDMIEKNFPKSRDSLMNANASDRRAFRASLNKELGLRFVDRLANIGLPGRPSKVVRELAKDLTFEG